jgi:hypothetical protein
VELEALPDWGFTEAAGEGCAFGGAQYRRVVEPGPGTEVLARFPDGRPAATSRTLGAGRAVYIATFAALAFQLRGDAASRDFLAGFLDPAGYPHLRRLSVRPGAAPGAPAPFVPNAVVRFLETPEEWVLVAVNHREDPAAIELEFDPSLVREASASLTVPGGSGIVRYFRKARD